MSPCGLVSKTGRWDIALKLISTFLSQSPKYLLYFCYIHISKKKKKKRRNSRKKQKTSQRARFERPSFHFIAVTGSGALVGPVLPPFKRKTPAV